MTIYNLQVVKMMIYVLHRVENIVGKWENAGWLPAFPLFLTMFSKAFLSKVVNSRDCVEKT